MLRLMSPSAACPASSLASDPPHGLAPLTRAAPARGMPRLVLDTNVCLALWLFRDRRLLALDAALQGGRCLWVGSPATRAELLHEIRPERCARYRVTPEAVLTAIAATPTATEVPASGFFPPASLRCRDPDDQIFVDVALETRADALLSRDRAVLGLRRAAAAQGLLICDPQAWIRDGLADV